MTVPQIIQDIASWWTLLMWGIGAALTTALLLLGLHWAAWKLVRELYGWPTIYRALREYRQNHNPQGEELKRRTRERGVKCGNTEPEH